MKVFVCCVALGQTCAQGSVVCGPGSLDKDVWLASARAAVDRGDFQGAEAELRRIVSADGNPVEAEYLLGYVLLRLNRPKDSLEMYTRAATLQTPKAEDLEHVADDYVLLNDFDDADRWMLRAVRMNDKDANLWYGLGRIRFSLQRFQDAKACFEKALALKPDSVAGQVRIEDNLGLAYEGLNHREDAIAAYKRALALQKNAGHPSEQPMLNLAILYVEDSRFEDALPLLRRAEEIAPTSPRIHEQLGQLYLKTNRLEDSRTELERSVELAPDRGPYHYLLGRVLQRLGQADRAKAEMDRSAELNSTHVSPD